MSEDLEEVVAGATEAVQDMLESEKWTVTVFVAPRGEGYRLLVRFNGERLKMGMPGSVGAEPSPRLAARNWVGRYLDSVARKRGQPGRRTLAARYGT